MELLARQSILPCNIETNLRDIASDNGISVVGIPLYLLRGEKQIFWVPIEINVAPVLYFDVSQAAQLNKPAISIKNFSITGINTFEADIGICTNGGYLATLNLTDGTLRTVSCKSKSLSKRVAAFASSDIYGYRKQTNELERHRLRILLSLKQCGLKNLKSFRTAYSSIQNILHGKQEVPILVVSPEKAKNYIKQLERLPVNLRQTLVEIALIGAAYNYHKETIQIIRAAHTKPSPSLEP